jgi:hypothetical protein
MEHGRFALNPADVASKGDQAMTSLAKLRRKLLTDPEVKAEYDRLGPNPVIPRWSHVSGGMRGTHEH